MLQKGHSVVSRRGFWRRAGALFAAPWILPAAARGADGFAAPSNRITLASIGVGCMGRGHLGGFLGQPDVQVLGVCDVDRWRRENSQAAVDLHYGRQRAEGSYRGCAAYVEMRELLARGDLDAVVIALGERWHPVATVLAAEAGKDVYVEKPVALSIAEGRAMVEAVRRHGRVCQVGLQQRTQPEFQTACQLVRAGALGKISTVYTVQNGVSQYVDLPGEPTPESLDWDRWLGPSPWHPFHHRFHDLGEPRNIVPWDFCRDFAMGSVGSGGVHAFDVVQWALGMDESGPIEVLPPECAPTKTLTFKYPGDVQVQVVDHRLDPARHEIPAGWELLTSVKTHGALFVGQRGWIHVGRRGDLTCYPANLIDNHPGRNAHRVSIHYRNWLEAIRARRRPACDIAVGCQSTIVSLLGCIARWTGRALTWDPAAEQFVGDEEANRLRRRALRDPWRV